MLNAILIRVGVDHAYGKWNAPVCTRTGRFFYLPIPEGSNARMRAGLARRYNEFVSPLAQYAELVGQKPGSLTMPEALESKPVHLDPDFEHLTYGDDGARRGSRVRMMKENDLIVFYAGLRPIDSSNRRLVYALIGLMVIDEVVEIGTIPQERWHENAHTRKEVFGRNDIVVRSKPGVSGRFDRCISIGEYRSGAYRVRRDILDEWGDLDVKDGFIQRSIRPPMFRDARRLASWLKSQHVSLLRTNNPTLESMRSRLSTRRVVSGDVSILSSARASKPGPASTSPSESGGNTPNVILIHLRRPRTEDRREDPFYEFGSFGCTGCHSKNLMKHEYLERLNGARIGFVQGGGDGHRLVLLTPPVQAVWCGERMELTWSASARPFKYECAPIVASTRQKSDFPMLQKDFANANRTTDVARFSSRFRARTRPLEPTLATELIEVYTQRTDSAKADEFAVSFDQTMDGNPRTGYDRKARFTAHRKAMFGISSDLSGSAPERRNKGARRSC